MLSYRFADLEIFNSPDGGYNIILDARIKEYKSVGENDVFIRIVEEPSNVEIISDNGKQIFKGISEQYSIIINAPNDIYNKLAYRSIIMYDEYGNMMKPRQLKDMHEEEIKFKSALGFEIWEDFYKQLWIRTGGKDYEI